MSVYAKLQRAKTKFHTLELTKSGKNKHQGYEYFELKDFIKPLIKLLDEEKLLSFCSFTNEIATLTVVDIEDDASMFISSPMSTAKLPACHEVQNLGAVETYIRRYLYMALFDIIDEDSVDSGKMIEDLSQKPITDIFKIKVGFGKYAKLSLGKLYTEDYDYFIWLLENATSPNIKQACEIMFKAAKEKEEKK